MTDAFRLSGILTFGTITFYALSPGLSLVKSGVLIVALSFFSSFFLGSRGAASLKILSSSTYLPDDFILIASLSACFFLICSFSFICIFIRSS